MGIRGLDVVAVVVTAVLVELGEFSDITSGFCFVELLNSLDLSGTVFSELVDSSEDMGLMLFDSIGVCA
ncbi:hypothetical protein NIES2100_23030 [Calothrix sp. NIES-2100]|nr:hypothetical protein NIES2100_23030 [Calothrix sp. NIES-2100]